MSTSKFLLGALVGAAIGVQIGVLVAPDKGINTRKKIGKKGGEYLDEANEKFNTFLDGLTKKVSDVSDEVDRLAKKTKSRSDEFAK